VLRNEAKLVLNSATASITACPSPSSSSGARAPAARLDSRMPMKRSKARHVAGNELTGTCWPVSVSSRVGSSRWLHMQGNTTQIKESMEGTTGQAH
jgi:hypothetical protein